MQRPHRRVGEDRAESRFERPGEDLREVEAGADEDAVRMSHGNLYRLDRHPRTSVSSLKKTVVTSRRRVLLSGRTTVPPPQATTLGVPPSRVWSNALYSRSLK